MAGKSVTIRPMEQPRHWINMKVGLRRQIHQCPPRARQMSNLNLQRLSTRFLIVWILTTSIGISQAFLQLPRKFDRAESMQSGNLRWLTRGLGLFDIHISTLGFGKLEQGLAVICRGASDNEDNSHLCLTDTVVSCIIR